MYEMLYLSLQRGSRNITTVDSTSWQACLCLSFSHLTDEIRRQCPVRRFVFVYCWGWTVSSTAISLAQL